MRFNWKNSDIATQAIVNTPKPRGITRSILVVIHNSTVMHVSLKLPLRKLKTENNPIPFPKKRTNKSKGKQYPITGSAVPQGRTKGLQRLPSYCFSPKLNAIDEFWVISR
ncbi:hypothetical protein PHYBLDRAFT_61884 [Phycomyces blakesleeanus NRRL 1555(-)]|uniref:Uncharacterized protein n=1 Tax=Phycomyces blakesleeanus (strain ATCC 8743b / DSM 1359 / FGSC 10004 / NBRC 33097 / NRRL 1555) TaxID=763407 RepID=A0A167R4L8_PHYB8|nr:hypothetical protein PHYBLDRAFT_61884 [Phycomyces blakesleeanus NRRL 1555(-)]OAD80829.1 hypothetical protein PHYBLDRAFT_61884 [Phycomyces blakesleeanus NRRL 1555(-)]|eukprot:XP_018298869.1 hypothetical protein PHYBLDRAFT_61884 [Phycomyces blakesleeanus NRRL 1555(-)]